MLKALLIVGVIALLAILLCGGSSGRTDGRDFGASNDDSD